MNGALSSASEKKVRLTAAISKMSSELMASLLLGSGSILILIYGIVISATHLAMLDARRSLRQFFSEHAIFFAALFSYPHFVWSYRFAYQQGKQFLIRHCFALIIFPVLLGLAYAACIALWAVPMKTLPGLGFIENSLLHTGLNMEKYQNAGQFLFALLFLAQFIASGYHYGMQALGVGYDGARKNGYPLNQKQKQFLTINMLALWIMNLCSGYSFVSIIEARYFGIHPVRFPEGVQVLSWLLFGASVLLVTRGVLMPIRKETGKLPPAPLVIPILSLWFWLQPFFQPYGFQLWVVPMAHGLQYIYYCFKVESKEASVINKNLKALLLYFTFAVAGYWLFRSIPTALDRAGLFNHLSANFFFVTAYVFLSLHHYVIDSVVWKSDSKMKQLLQQEGA